MKILTVTITALIISVEADILLDNSIYKLDALIYKAKNNIVDIHSPMINDKVVFYTEKHDEDFNIYTLESDENNKFIATKVLNNGRCTSSDNNTVYFGAKDGIYTYNLSSKIPEKYGNITADIKAIQKDSKQDIIYIIADNGLSKVTDLGRKIKKISNAEQMVLDKDDNVYFCDRDTKVKVIVNGQFKEVNGLKTAKEVKLIRSFASSEGVLLVLDKKIHRIFANGTSAETNYVFDKVPTAFFLDIGIIQLFGYHKELYQFNIFEPLLQGFSSAIGDFYSTIFVN